MIAMNKYTAIIVLLFALGLSACFSDVKKDSIANLSSIPENGEAELLQIAPVAEKPLQIDKNTVPKAVNSGSSGSFGELDMEQYFSKIDKAWETGPEKGFLAIPSVGAMFKTGSSELLDYYKEMLDEFVSLYKETDGTSKILIEGYSSNNGKETVKNPQLSKQRAIAVANYLQEKGISSKVFEVKAYANKKVSSGIFAKDKSCSGASCFRRVDVSIKN